MTSILQIKPAAIEAKSFAIIEEEFHERTGMIQQDFTPEQFAVLRRTIHATGDFAFADTIRFHNDAISRAIEAIKTGKDIITDVNGIDHKWREELANQLIKIQNEEGWWQNENGRLWENNKVLVTAYSILSLEEIML